jgi:hypothetical protein
LAVPIVGSRQREFDTYAKHYGSLAESVLVILKRNVANGINPAIDLDLAQAVICMASDRIRAEDEAEELSEAA